MRESSGWERGTTIVWQGNLPLYTGGRYHALLAMALSKSRPTRGFTIEGIWSGRWELLPWRWSDGASSKTMSDEQTGCKIQRRRAGDCHGVKLNREINVKLER